jgi:hypothetical protein
VQALIRLIFDETIGKCSIAHNRSEQIANVAEDILAHLVATLRLSYRSPDSTLVPSPHIQMIADAAKRNLAPMGLIRKGRSRTWLDDRGWYLTVVEFQPSGFSKGSYLNIGAHFLWSWSGHLSFDLGYRIDGYIPFHAEEQFASAIEGLAVTAAAEVARLRGLLVNPGAVPNAIPSDPQPTGWPSYHRAISMALSGRTSESAVLFGGLAKPALEYCSTDSHRAHEIDRAEKCKSLAADLGNPTAFCAAIFKLITTQRLALHLNAITDLAI